MSRQRHFAVDELSEDARMIIHAGFLARHTLQTIVTAVHAATQETVVVSSLSRYRTWWLSEHRKAQEARAFAEEVSTALREHPTAEVASAIEQKLEQLFLVKLRELDGADPLEIADLGLRARKVKLEAQRLALDQARLEAGVGDPAQLFLAWATQLVAYLRERDQDALAALEPHLKGFAHVVKAA